MAEPQADPARGKNIVFYDGICTFCDGTVKTLYRLDTKKNLSFATLQGELGRHLVAKHAAQLEGVDSIILATGYGTGHQRIDVKSSALLRIVESLGGPWRLAALGRLIPAPLRDPLYDCIARHRYQWFGKQNLEACLLPPPEDQHRFFN